MGNIDNERVNGDDDDNRESNSGIEKVGGIIVAEQRNEEWEEQD